MAEPISIQQLKDASEDAITLADFIYKPANVMIPRRLAADINSLQYYLDYMSSYAQHSYETYDEMVANAPNLPNGVGAFVTNNLDTAKNGIYTYNGNSFVKGEYQPENAAKEFVEAKLGGLEVFDGKVRAQDVSTADGSTQNLKNTMFSLELSKQKLDTGITATAKFGGVARIQSEVNSDTVSALGFADMQAALNYNKTGELLIPAGTYNIDSDLIITSKGASPDKGSFVINAKGVIFTGLGRLIINSSKRVEINGLDMATQDIVLRGCWHSNFNTIKFRRLIIGDIVGSNFSSNYWNNFKSCLFQAIVVEALADVSNEFSFDSCQMRGNNQQGFTSSYDYAFDFKSMKNVQGWKFWGGDISYHAVDVYRIASANTADVELDFMGTYFDSVLPNPIARKQTRISVEKCHHANATILALPIEAAGRGCVDYWRQDRSFKYTTVSSQNLVPNGDLRTAMSKWVGTGKPITNDGAAVITTKSGGFSGNYININQAKTTGNSVYLGCNAIPVSGVATATIIMRATSEVPQTMRFNMFGLFGDADISNEWTAVTMTTQYIEAGVVPAFSIYTSNGKSFNVDVAYIGVNVGEGSDLILPNLQPKSILHTEKLDFASIAAGTSKTVLATVAGAGLGDFVNISTLAALGELEITHPRVSATGKVTVTLRNNTAAPIAVPLADWYVRVTQQS